MIAFSLFVTVPALKQSQRTARRSPLIQVSIILINMYEMTFQKAATGKKGKKTPTTYTLR